MEKIKSTYYPERLYGGGRWKHEPYNADDLEHNPPPKIDHVDIELTPYTEKFQPEWMFADVHEIETERQVKMRKVIAHLNKKPFRINWDNVQLIFVMLSLLWFFGRSLWFIFTGK